MAISGGPRRLAGLQRTPAAYANEAALAISGRADEEGAAAPRDRGARCPAPPHIAGSGAALLGRPGCGSGGARSVCAAARAPPAAAAAGRPLPERAAAGRAPTRRLCLARAARAPRLLFRARGVGRPPSLLRRGSQRRSARRARSGSGAPRSPDLLARPRVPSAGFPRRPAGLGGSRPERSGVRTPGWQDFGKTNFPVRKRRGPRGSSPPLPPLRSPSLPLPPLPAPQPAGPTDSGAPRPARCRHRGRLAPAPARLGLCAAGGFLNTGKGGDRRAPVFPTLVPLHHGPPGASGVGSERDRKFQLHQTPARGPPCSRDFGDDTGASGPVWCEPSAQMASWSFPESFAGGSGR
ncbi:collagen alpha-1(I) chain [Pan paniscus]|uniref:collagen alpha-1(I) chain n=1 Tax=Pan paniscus TaxID=9597 RepID=UPI003005A85A